jgi:hypothetical protein
VALITALAALVVAPNLWLVWRAIGLIVNGEVAVDWVQYVAAGDRFFDPPSLYAVTNDYAYRYSPFLAPLFGLIAPIGAIGWRVLHLVAAAALPNWPMRIIALLSWPFWYDVQTGNILIYVVLLAAWALRGNRVVAVAYLLLLIMVPRPLMVPVGLWLLWRRPELRVPFIVILLVHSTAVLVGGWAPDWIGTLTATSEDALLPSNVGPSRFIGAWWLLIGLPLSGLLTLWGRLGWASLAASPYWLPYYLLMLVLETIGGTGVREAAPSPLADTGHQLDVTGVEG